MLEEKVVVVIDAGFDSTHPIFPPNIFHQVPIQKSASYDFCNDDQVGCNLNAFTGEDAHFFLPHDGGTYYFYEDKVGCNLTSFTESFPTIKFRGIKLGDKIASKWLHEHGSAVAGVVASTDLSSVKLLYIEDEHHSPGPSALSLAYAKSRGATVISISSTRELTFCQFCPPTLPDFTSDRHFIECANKLNVPIIVAAGNDDCDLSMCKHANPAGLPIPNMVVVGAAHNRMITRYSNYAGPVQIAAEIPPLVAVPCTNSIWFNTAVCCFTPRDGTSYAAPVVARVFAEIQSQRPDLSLTAEEFTNLVIETGIKPDNYAEKPTIILDPKKLSEKLGIQLTVDDQHCYGIHTYNQYLCSTLLHPLYYIPIAILYGLFSDVIFLAVQKNFSLKNSKNLNSCLILGVFLETYVRSLLPLPASIIENMTHAFRIGAVESYNQQTALKGSTGEERRNNIYKEAVKAGLWGITKTTLVVGVASAVPFGAQIYNFISGASRRFCSTQRAANVSFFSRAKDSLSAGVKNVIDSIPGSEYLTKVSNQCEDNWKKYNRYTYLHWMKYLNDNASFKSLNHAELKSEFEHWLKSKTEKYLNENPDVNPHDILLPSYDDVLAVQAGKLHLQ